MWAALHRVGLRSVIGRSIIAYGSANLIWINALEQHSLFTFHDTEKEEGQMPASYNHHWSIFKALTICEKFEKGPSAPRLKHIWISRAEHVRFSIQYALGADILVSEPSDPVS
jgi:hypothetical protein